MGSIMTIGPVFSFPSTRRDAMQFDRIGSLDFQQDLCRLNPMVQPAFEAAGITVQAECEFKRGELRSGNTMQVVRYGRTRCLDKERS